MKVFSRQIIVITAFSVVLAAAIGGVLYLYSQNRDLQQGLQECEKRFSDREAKVAQMAADQKKEMESTYEVLVSNLKEEMKKQEVTIENLHEAISATFVDRILFEFGKASLTPEGERILGKVGGALKNIKGKKIRVTGHADIVPIHPDYQYKFPTNWELSAARAATVVRYFQEKTGLDPKDMEAVGRSFYHPEASNETKEGRARNRRVEIYIAPQTEIKK
jgi:chemotaxis protein MotB